MTYASELRGTMNTSMKLLALVALAAAMTLASCATTPQELKTARATYEEAEREASSEVPAEVAEAKEALERAEQEFEDEGNEMSTRTFAHVATRKSQNAITRAQMARAERKRTQGQQRLVQIQEQARKNLKTALREERQYNQMTQQQLENEEQKIEQMRAELKKARQAGELTEEQLTEKRMKLQQTMNDLEQARAQKKELAEKLEATKKKLSEVAKIKEEEKKTTITLNGSILFEVGKATLRTTAEQRLQQVATVLKNADGKEILIEGHTDSQGKSAMNQRLSKDRAAAVQRFLVRQGVQADRIKTVGMGEAQPIATNETPEGRANNRRVEIVVGEDVYGS